MSKVLAGLINNNLGRSDLIKTRFLLVDTMFGTVDDVTEKLCECVNKAKISNFKYKDGVAVYSFGCGLSHYLSNENLSEIESFKDCRLEMFTKSDIKHILSSKNVFDDNIKTNLYKYVYERESFKRKQELIEMTSKNIKLYESILDGKVEKYKKQMNDKIFIKDVTSRLNMEKESLKNLLNE